jgi:hypothetical protein
MALPGRWNVLSCSTTFTDLEGTVAVNVLQELFGWRNIDKLLAQVRRLADTIDKAKNTRAAQSVVLCAPRE